MSEQADLTQQPERIPDRLGPTDQQRMIMPSLPRI